MKRLRRSTVWLLPTVLLTSFGWLSACSKKSATGVSWGGNAAFPTLGPVPGMRKTWGLQPMPGSIFHVEYSPNTAIVDLKTVARALRGVSADQRIFLFQDSPALRQKLVPGKCVLFEGLDLRKVDALAVDGSTLIVGTETAPLREALKNAQIQFALPVDFKEIHDQIAAERNLLETPPRFALLESLSNLWDALEPKVYAATSNDLEGEAEFSDDTDAKWKLKGHNVFNPDHSVDVDVQVNRETEDGLTVEINAKAHLSKFIQQDEILMSDGQLKSASFQNVGLHGNVDFNWGIETVKGKMPMQEARVKFPHPLKIPLIESTGLPMSLEISEALLFHPAFTTSGELAKGDFQVTYSGDEGIKIQGKHLETPGKVQGSVELGPTHGLSPLAAYGVVVAIAVPRVELKMGAESLFEAADISQATVNNAVAILSKLPIAGNWIHNTVPNVLATQGSAYFQIVISSTAANSGLQSLVPCQQYTMDTKGQVGMDANWLGTEMSSPTKDIFSIHGARWDPDSKICGDPNASN